MGALAAIGVGLACAETYNGRLLDAACVDQNKSKNCDPVDNVAAFVLVVNGKAYHLDDAGNTKAIQAMKDRSDRRKDPAAAATTMVAAKVSGTADGDVIRVDAIEIQ